MRFAWLALGAALCMAAPVSRGQSTEKSTTGQAETKLTLGEALARARAANPTLRAAQARLAAAEGAAEEAGALLRNNPQLTLDGTSRSVPVDGATERRPEWAAGLAQTFEIAGQPGHRREAAGQALQALRFELADLDAQQAAEVAQRFYRVLALQQRRNLEAQAARLFEETARAVERRRAAGEDTRLDANLALVEVERARNQLGAIDEQLVDARAALAQVMQLPADSLPVVRGDLAPTKAPYTEAVLIDAARTHPHLLGLAARQSGAEARLRLERAARTPDITVGLSVGREGPIGMRERFTTLSLSVPLPFFNRNAAAIGGASSDAAQAQIEREAAMRDVPAQIHVLWLRLESLRQRTERLQTSVLPALASNEQLSTKSLRAGQIGLLELIVASRQALDARRDLVDALLDFQTTRLSLEAAAGWTDAR